MATTHKARKKGTGLNQWATRGRYNFRLLAVIERAKREGTLTNLSPHWNVPISEQEAAARVRVDEERILIAENEKHIVERQRRNQQKYRERVKRERAEAEAELEELALAELMEQAA